MGATAIIAGVGMLSAYLDGESAKRKADYDLAVAQSNIKMSEFAAERTIKSAEKSAQDFGKRVRLTVGSQRANFAAQGIEVDSGDAMDIQVETGNIGAEEMNIIRNNGYLEAWGIRTAAQSNLRSAENNRDAVAYDANVSLITSGLGGAASLYKEYSGGKSKTSSKAKTGHFSSSSAGDNDAALYGWSPGYKSYNSKYFGKLGG